MITRALLLLLTVTSLFASDDLAEVAARSSEAFVFIGGGSGVIIDPDGIMLTNFHVAGDQHTWVVRNQDRLYHATALGHDPIGDITVLQIHADEPLPAVPIGDSEALVVGDTVIAIGNPFATGTGFNDATISVGIVSALHRYQGTYSDAIQHDAPINPGNSGGPLLDAQGRLVGINGRITSRTGARANTGIGQAIPTSQIERFLPLLLAADGGLVRHGLLRGIQLDNDEADGLRNGAEITSVHADSVAAEAGLQAGDRIIAVGDEPVPSPTRLLGIIGTWPAGAMITLAVQRDDRQITIPVTLDPNDPPNWGLRWRLDGGPDRVVVAEVGDSGPGANAGLTPDDRLIAMNGDLTDNARSLREWLRAHNPQAGESIAITVERLGPAGDPLTVTAEVVLGSRLEAQLPSPNDDSKQE